MSTDAFLNSFILSAQQSALAELAARASESSAVESESERVAVAELLHLLSAQGQVKCEVRATREPSAPSESL